MNKSLAWVGSIAGVLSAIVLIRGLPSFDGFAKFNSCTSTTTTASTSRTLQWSGGDSVEIRVPGSVHFKVGPEWTAVATGPTATLNHLRISNGRIEFDRWFNSCGQDIKIELAGPAVRRWVLSGSGAAVLDELNQAELDIVVAGSGSAMVTGHVQHTKATLNGSGQLNLDGLAQTGIDLDIQGSGSATASGNAERTRISISGSGDARLGKLVVRDANVQINGSGDVDIAPEETIQIQINGSGDVRMLKRPKSVTTRVNGSGSIVSAI